MQKQVKIWQNTIDNAVVHFSDLHAYNTANNQLIMFKFVTEANSNNS